MKKMLATNSSFWLLLSKIFIFLVILAQLWTIFIIAKPFWLDEWSSLFNLKNLAYSNLFGPLLESQEFPRIYLAFMKYLAEKSNYSPILLKIPATIFGILSLVTVYFISKKIYKTDNFFSTFFILLILANNVVLYNFTQLKAYSGDLFFALIAIIQFFYLLNNNKIFTFWSPLILLIGPILSYTYPIAVSPVVLLYFFQIFNFKTSAHNSIKSLLCLVCFFIGCAIVWFTDLKFVLTDSNMYNCWRIYVVDYSSFSAFLMGIKTAGFSLFTIFTGPTTTQGHNFLNIPLIAYQWFLFIISFIGFCSVCLSELKLFVHCKWRYFLECGNRIQAYFFLLFLSTWFLYFLKLLPVIGNRMNVYCVPMMIFFFLQGLLTLKRTGANLYLKKLTTFITVAFFIFMIAYMLARYIEMFAGGTNWYEPASYDNFGKALAYAQTNNGVIAVNINTHFNTLVDASSVQMAILAYPRYNSNQTYDMQKKIPVVVYANDNTPICQVCTQAKQPIVFVYKYNFSVASCNTYCQKNYH